MVHPSIQQQLAEGDAHLQAGRLQQAMAAYQPLLTRTPNNAAVVNRVGRVLLAAGQHAQAVVAFARARLLDPRTAVYAFDHANALRAASQRAEAIDAYLAALQLDPASVDATLNLGITLAESGRLTEAIAQFQRAVELSPEDADVYANLGEALRQAKRIAPAIAALRRATELNPRFDIGFASLGSALRDDNQLHEAEQCYARAISLRPSFGPYHANLASILRDSGRPEEAMDSLRRAAELAPDDRGIGTNLLYSMHFDPRCTPQAIVEAHARWADRFANPVTDASTPAEPIDRDPERRLRVGYVSGHFAHSVISFLFEPLMESHDRERFEIVCFSDVPMPDAVTERMRSYASEWISVAGLGDKQVAALVTERKIDILVDLAGHTDRNRLPAFARKPAPVQVTYLGYPDTTGMRAMDWRISDGWHDPEGVNDAFCVERLWRLPRCAWAFRPPADPRPVGTLPFVANGFITFGSLNIFSKVNEGVLDTWSAVLGRVAGSRLVMLCAKDEPIRQRVRDAFARRGVAPDRLTLFGRQPRHDYLDTFNRIDVALDPFPFAGHTTSLDSLLMGVPFVTLAGVTHVQRTGVSLLSAVGLEDLIAGNLDAYVETAAGLAGDAERLRRLRAELPGTMRRSPLMDGPGLARAVEAAYREMWRRRVGTP